MFHSKLFANIDEEKRAAEEKYRILYFSKEVMETAISEINMNLDQSMPPVFAVLKRFADIGEPFQYGEPEKMLIVVEQGIPYFLVNVHYTNEVYKITYTSPVMNKSLPTSTSC